MENDELTKFQLLAMEQRIIEINNLIESDIELDEDVYNNLIDEIDRIEQKCTQSIKSIFKRERKNNINFRIKKIGLKIV